MAWPVTRLYTFVDNSTPTYDANWGNNVELAINGAYAGTKSLSGVVVDGNGGNAFVTTSTTPRVFVRNTAGSGRWLVDYNGLPTGGRVSVLREEWPYIADPSGPPQVRATWTNTVWSYDLNTAGAINVEAPSASYNARYLQLTPTTVVGQSTTLWGPPLFVANTAGMSCVMEFELGMNTALAGVSSNCEVTVGLQDLPDAPGSNTNVIILYKNRTATNYQTFTAVGGTQTVTALNTPTAPTAGTFPKDRIRIEIQGSASPYGAYQVLFFINEALVSTVSAATLPGAVALRPVFSLDTAAAPAGSPLAYVGPCIVTWNRFASGPAL